MFALIAFEIPGLTGISGSVLPRGHHLKLPMEKSQLRVSSWRKQFSCITSSMSSAYGSGSQERQNQQMQVRYRGSLQFCGSRSAVLSLGAGRGELAAAFRHRDRAQNHPSLLNCRATLTLQEKYIPLLWLPVIPGYHFDISCSARKKSAGLCIRFSPLHLSTILYSQKTKL